jgi:hypothetical protein
MARGPAGGFGTAPPRAVVARTIETVRRYDAEQFGRGGERLSAEGLRAQDPALFADIDAFAPGLLDVFMSAIGGDADALVKIGKITACQTTELAIGDPMTMFGALRQALEDQAAQLAERIEALDSVEAALARLHDVFGMPPGGGTGGRRTGGDRPGPPKCEPTLPRPSWTPPRRRHGHARCAAGTSRRRACAAVRSSVSARSGAGSGRTPRGCNNPQPGMRRWPRTSPRCRIGLTGRLRLGLRTRTRATS